MNEYTIWLCNKCEISEYLAIVPVSTKNYADHLAYETAKELSYIDISFTLNMHNNIIIVEKKSIQFIPPYIEYLYGKRWNKIFKKVGNWSNINQDNIDRFFEMLYKCKY